MLNFVYLRSSRLKVLHCLLDSCIANNGEKFELEMACWMHLEVFQVVSSQFWALMCTGLTGRGHRSDRSECWSYAHVGHRSDQWWWAVWPVRAEVVQLPCFQVVCALVHEELHWFRGSMHVCRGNSLCIFRALFRWFALFAWALFCLGCVELLPLPKVSDTWLLQVILLFVFVWLSIACWSFFLFVSFLFLFSVVTFVWVLLMHSSRGEIKDHVWFEDRWMVVSLCDEWFTTLCGLILG
jgi:hypothetical protein